MPIYRKDRLGGYYKLFTEQSFEKPHDPGRQFCRYFDEKGDSGVADVEQCLRSTQPADEEEYQILRDRNSL